MLPLDMPSSVPLSWLTTAGRPHRHEIVQSLFKAYSVSGCLLYLHTRECHIYCLCGSLLLPKTQYGQGQAHCLSTQPLLTLHSYHICQHHHSVQKAWSLGFIFDSSLSLLPHIQSVAKSNYVFLYNMTEIQSFLSVSLTKSFWSVL